MRIEGGRGSGADSKEGDLLDFISIKGEEGEKRGRRGNNHRNN
jgi:hypothetical protein